MRAHTYTRGPGLERPGNAARARARKVRPARANPEPRRTERRRPINPQGVDVCMPGAEGIVCNNDL